MSQKSVVWKQCGLTPTEYTLLNKNEEKSSHLPFGKKKNQSSMMSRS
jgi:hypothetical protein